MQMFFLFIFAAALLPPRPCAAAGPAARRATMAGQVRMILSFPDPVQGLRVLKTASQTPLNLPPVPNAELEAAEAAWNLIANPAFSRLSPEDSRYRALAAKWGKAELAQLHAAALKIARAPDSAQALGALAVETRKLEELADLDEDALSELDAFFSGTHAAPVPAAAADLPRDSAASGAALEAALRRRLDLGLVALAAGRRRPGARRRRPGSASPEIAESLRPVFADYNQFLLERPDLIVPESVRLAVRGIAYSPPTDALMPIAQWIHESSLALIEILMAARPEAGRDADLERAGEHLRKEFRMEKVMDGMFAGMLAPMFASITALMGPVIAKQAWVLWRSGTILTPQELKAVPPLALWPGVAVLTASYALLLLAYGLVRHILHRRHEDPRRTAFLAIRQEQARRLNREAATAGLSPEKP